MAEENVEIVAVESTPVIEQAVIGAPTEAELLSMDSEYQEYLDQEKNAGEQETTKEGNVTEEVTDEDEDEDAETSEESTEAADPVKAEGVEFEDDILPGLTGDQFKGFDEPIREIIAKSREELDTVTEKANKAQEKLDSLLNDPIVKERADAIASGRNKLEYKVPEVVVDDATVEKLQELIDVDTPESRKEFKDLINKQVSDAVKEVAETVTDNTLLRAQADFERKQNIRGASEKVIALAKLLKVELPSSDYMVIADTPISDLGEIGVALKDLETRAKKGLIGNVQKYLAETDVEELYASMAIKNKWPLLKNADKLISKQIKDSNRKFHERFIKGKPDEANGSFVKGWSADQKAQSSKTVKEGIDLVKLATDDRYHESILYSKMDDGGWADKVAVLRNEGERMVEENPRLHAPRGNK